MRAWSRFAPRHLVQTIAEWSAKPKRTFDQWHDLWTDIEACGVHLGAHVDAKMLIAMVNAFRPRARHAAKVLHVLLTRYVGEPMPVLQRLFLLDEYLFLNAFSARPDWACDYQRDEAVVKDMIAHFIHSRQMHLITYVEYVVGRYHTGTYWPEHVLPSVLDDEDLSDSFSPKNGIYVMDAPQITLDNYSLCQAG